MTPEQLWADYGRWVDALLDQPEANRLTWLATQQIPEPIKVKLRQLCIEPQSADWLEQGAKIWLEKSPLQAGARFGRYQLLTQLGEGGASVVWGAERLDDSKQKVAIKCLKAGLLTDQARKHFINEQRMLARLAHPNIVQLLDVGVSEQGVPFIVTEWLQGQNIVAAALSERLPERLTLWLALAEAVNFAHQSLVLHRDLKPSNALVTKQGQVKLLDFGIGRVMLSEHDSAPTMMTSLTPAYAAPEQFVYSAPTTAIDVFGLGTVLFEMLTARAPFADIDRLRDLSASAPLASSASRVQKRGLEPSLLKGDLDTVLSKALANEATARYVSVAAFASDVRAVLQQRPITARTPSFSYMALRFAQRNRFALALTVLLACVLTYSSISIYRANQQSEQQKRRAETSLAFVESLFRNELREQPNAELPSTRELLERGVERAAVELQDDPEGHAQVLAWIARAFAQSDQHQKAIELYSLALDLGRERQSLLRWEMDRLDSSIAASDDRKAHWSSWTRLWELQQDSDRIAARLLSQKAQLQVSENNFVQAEQSLQSAIQQATAQSASVESLASIQLQLSAIYTALNQHADAATLAERASLGLATVERASARQRAQALSAWATALAWNSDHRAEAKLREALAFNRSLSRSANMPSAEIANVLGNILVVQARFDEARELLQFSWQTRRDLLGEKHQDTENVRGDLILLEFRTGKLQWAADAWREQLQTLSDDTPAREGILRGNLANALVELGQLDEAQTMAEQSLKLRRESLGEQSLAPAYYSLWRIAEERGQLERGYSLLQESLAILDRGDPKSSDRGLILLCLADTERRLGKMQQARSHLDAAIALNHEVLPPAHMRFGLLHLADAAWHDANGQSDQARVAFANAMQAFHPGAYVSKRRQEEILALQQRLQLNLRP